jgi:transcriptional regulator with XRE-family HTH domain
MSDFEKKLAQDFQRGREYREAYAEAFANEYLATQIQVLRKQRGLTQAQLGERIGSNQGRISVYEDEEYGRWSLDTLRKIAHELGLWVKVSFESYSTLAAEAAQFDAHNLTRSGFEEDAEVQRWLEQDEPVSWQERTRRMAAKWAAAPLPNLSTLADWLQGSRLPGFEVNQTTPVQHLRAAIPPSEKDLWNAIAAGVARLLAAEEAGIELPPPPNPAIYQENLFGLAEALGPRKEIQDALDKAYTWAEKTFEQEGQTGLGPAGESALVRAMIHNQTDEHWRESVWNTYLEHGRHPFLPGGTMMWIRGLLGLPQDEDYWRNLARGVRDLERRLMLEGNARVGSSINVIDELEHAIAVIFDRWDSPEAAQNLMRGSLDLMASEGRWIMHASAAWAHAVDRRGWSSAVWSVESNFERTTLANMLVDGLQWYRDWQKAREKATAIPAADQNLDNLLATQQLARGIIMSLQGTA